MDTAEDATPQDGYPPPARAAEVRLAVLALSALALSQAALLIFAGRGMTRVAAVGLAIGGINARIRLLSVLAALIVVNFGAHLAGLAPPFPYRLAHVSILALYAAMALAGFAAVVFKTKFGAALVAAGPLALAFIASEAVIEQIAPPTMLSRPRIEWVGEPEADSTLGEAYRPYALLRTVYPDNPRGYFHAAGAAPVEYSETYALNALSCRGQDYPIPRPVSRRRILVLGGASAFGVGVHEPDTFAARLERSLNATPPQSQPQGYDVINCGTYGYATRQQRIFYERVAWRYDANVIILAMSSHDNISNRDEAQLGYLHEAGKYERLLFSLHLIQQARHEGRLTFDYSSTLEELSKLREACRAHGARLAVVIFRNADLVFPWSALVTGVSSRLQGTDVPVLDLGPALLKDQTPEDLMVHPTDPSPNEIAHRIAAEAIEQFLRRQGFIA